MRGSGGCPGLLVLQESSKTPGKGLLSDREAGPLWADSPSISDVGFFVVVLTFSAWLVNLLKANFQQGAQSTPVWVIGSFELPPKRLGTSF